MLSYLQLLENPSFLPAFSRCVGRIRSIGDRTVREIITYSANNGQTLFKTCIRLAEGATIVKLNDGQRKGMKEFVAMIMKLTGLAHNVS
jgi:superfamily I DNA/RNA helicase